MRVLFNVILPSSFIPQSLWSEVLSWTKLLLPSSLPLLRLLLSYSQDQRSFPSGSDCLTFFLIYRNSPAIAVITAIITNEETAIEGRRERKTEGDPVNDDAANNNISIDS